MLILKAVGTLAEWSKALDLSPNIERCVGSNPTGTIFKFFKLLITIKSMIIFYIIPNPSVSNKANFNFFSISSFDS